MASQLLQRPTVWCSEVLCQDSDKLQFKVATVLFSYTCKVCHDTWLHFTSQPYFLLFPLPFAHFALAKLAFSFFFQLQVLPCHRAFAHAVLSACQVLGFLFLNCTFFAWLTPSQVSVLRLNITFLEKPFPQSRLGSPALYCYRVIAA